MCMLSDLLFNLNYYIFIPHEHNQLDRKKSEYRWTHHG